MLPGSCSTNQSVYGLFDACLRGRRPEKYIMHGIRQQRVPVVAVFVIHGNEKWAKVGACFLLWMPGYRVLEEERPPSIHRRNCFICLLVRVQGRLSLG